MGAKRKTSGALNKAGRLAAASLILCVTAMGASVRMPPEPEPAPEPTPEPASAAATATPTPEPTPDPTPEPTPEYFTITMLGDCTLGASHYSKSVSTSYESVVGDNYAYPFEKTVHLFNEDDFTIANLECALTDYNMPDAYKAFTFKGDPAYVNVLTEGSVEFVSIGNNHSIDYGQQGYDDTKAVLESAGIGYAGRDEWALYTTESGLTIGVYGWSFGQTSEIEAGIAALKEAGAEFIIAALHWGIEGYYTLNHLQEGQGRAAIDAGADVVMGTHPHTLQKIEEYNGGYIYYSVGNWTFGGNTNPRDKDTVIVRLTVMRDVDGKVSIVEREHIPCASSGVTNGNNYQPVPYEIGSEEYERTLRKLEGEFEGPNLTVDYSYAAE